MSHSLTNATLVNAVERPSIKFKIPSSTSRKSFYSIIGVHRKQSEAHHLVPCWDDVEVAIVEWESALELELCPNPQSGRVVFRRHEKYDV